MVRGYVLYNEAHKLLLHSHWSEYRKLRKKLITKEGVSTKNARNKCVVILKYKYRKEYLTIIEGLKEDQPQKRTKFPLPARLLKEPPITSLATSVARRAVLINHYTEYRELLAERVAEQGNSMRVRHRAASSIIYKYSSEYREEIKKAREKGHPWSCERDATAQSRSNQKAQQEVSQH